jgi:CheY-like chemotaxis protein
MFSANAIDLVLLDYAMPGLDGGLIARELKRRRPYVPVIIVSASPLPEEIRTCADCIVAKGEGPSLLLEAMRNLLDGSKT